MIKKEYVECPSKRHLKFKDLEVGQIFLIHDCGDLCMRIREFIDYQGESVNFVNLESADTDYLDDNDEVLLINKEITIAFSDDDIVEWMAKKED